MKTARQVVAQELIRWLDNEDIGRFTECQRLESESYIWEFGKWSAKDGDQLGYKPQLRFRGSRPESTAWDAIPDISDDLAMRIHEVFRTLPAVEHNILMHLYFWWEPPHVAVEKMRIGTTRFYRHRKEALQKIADHLAATA